MKLWTPALFLITATLAVPSRAKSAVVAKPASKPTTQTPSKPVAKSGTSSTATATKAKTQEGPSIPFSRGSMTDSRDGTAYKTVTIGKQTWMAQNLDFASDGSMCFENRKDRCDQFGRLYDWDAAKTSCPSGWRLSSDEDWKELEKTLGTADSAGRLLKTTTGWSTNGNGTDRVGFSAIAAGNSDKTGIFNNLEFAATFWTSSKKFFGDPWHRRLRFDETSVERETSEKSYLYSVRCLKSSP